MRADDGTGSVQPICFDLDFSNDIGGFHTRGGTGILFPAYYVSGAFSPGGSVSDLVSRTARVRDRYLEALNDTKSFKGVYATAQLERSADDGGDESLLALEWELFDEGWYEANKDLDKKKIETKVQFFQMLRDLRIHEHNERTHRLKVLGNTVHLYQAQKRHKILERLLPKYAQRLESGYATMAEFQRVAYQYRRSRIDLTHYSGLTRSKLSPTEFTLLNNIERFALKDNRALAELAMLNSYDLALQDLFIDRSEFFPNWLDDLSVRLYMEYDENPVSRDRENIFGLQVRIPLNLDRGRNGLIDIEKAAYRDQQRAIKLRIGQRIDSISESFRFQQKRIESISSEHRFLKTQWKLQEERARHTLAALPAVPEKTIEVLELELNQKQEDVLLARLKAYAELLTLEHLVAPESLRDLVLD